ncbi:MAG TPA: hypothetical protein VKZ68_02635 [Ohtaekwangia sp.]|nr:hypothetical protein [Ohtaekwangia sp.]
MKIPSIFSKTPKHKRFNYAPRFYDAQQEEFREREERIKRELEAERLKNGAASDADDIEESPSVTGAYRSRIPGSFKMAKKSAKVQADPSANILRLIVLFVLVIGLIAYIQYGTIALYVTAFLFLPLYFYLKFRKPRS